MAASCWARRYTAGPIDVTLVLGTDLDDTSPAATRYSGGGRVISFFPGRSSSDDPASVR